MNDQITLSAVEQAEIDRAAKIECPDGAAYPPRQGRRGQRR
jgi:hypothetical protein